MMAIDRPLGCAARVRSPLWDGRSRLRAIAIHTDGDVPEGTRPAASTISVPTVMESGGVEPWFNVYRPMDLATTGLPLPVIVWANGGCEPGVWT
jgi:hypothetical protein